ncbi:MAG: pilus assembly protein PilM, partial [Microthrixaceae bacterium]|nr:pilus assembly protein PilM [Microthrixaceae bacterium]
MATDRHVRVAAVMKNGHVRTAETPLDPGVVVQGEVVDVDALAAAIKSAVGSERFGTRSVVVGVAGRDAVTRQVEIPAMADKDLRSALTYELNDMLPFPPAEAVVDYLRIEDVTDENERSVARLLAVAIHRSAVDPLLDAVRRGGLTPVALDLAAFGLVRSAWTGGSDGVGATALVHLGDTTMTVVVVEGDVVRFTRQVGVADDHESGAADLDADLAFVERFRTRGSAGSGSTATATMERTDPIVAA